MAFPTHPDLVVLRNKYYPNGLTEENIWKYYQSVKKELIEECNNREIFINLYTDLNQTVVKRRDKSTNQFLQLTNESYDKIMGGRTISISATNKQIENKGIIDIDTNDFNVAKNVTYETYNYFKDNSLISDVQIRFTGKTSFHIHLFFKKKNNIDNIRLFLRKNIIQSDLLKIATMEAKRNENLPNLDLAPNKFRGGYIALHSLSIIGLRCIIIDPKEIMSFNPEMAKI